jgi:hypothetical protein
MDRRRFVVAVWGYDLRRVGFDDALCRWRVCVSAWGLWRPDWLSLHVDVVCCRQARFDRFCDEWAGTNAGNFRSLSLAGYGGNRWAAAGDVVADFCDYDDLADHRAELPGNKKGSLC